MAEVAFLGRPALAGVGCPYCAALVDPEDAGIVAAQQSWGWVGVAATADGRLAGRLLVVPAEDRTALVRSLWVAPALVRSGVGTRLVQGVAAGLLRRDLRAVVAVASRRHPTCQAPPRDFLRAVGFSRGLDEKLWRLDLDLTVVERPRLLTAFERFVEAIRPVAPPEPAGRATRES
ncbi:MAG: GNAT family N-acetyltransferase [Propionibacteriaceae bacterium]|nr:GNAT family N-acetyltransferase [Propionibacteriaceae bacterium]